MVIKGKIDELKNALQPVFLNLNIFNRFTFLKCFSLVCLFSLFQSPAFAVFDKGGVSGIGARPLGMGGAFSTVADSSDAIFYNPAGLVQVLRPEISGVGAVLLNGKEDLFDLAYVQPFSDQLAWAIAVQDLNDNGGPSEGSEKIYYATFAAPLAVDKSIS